MPIPSLQVASPSGVFPKLTYTSFQETRVFPLISQSSHDGYNIRSLIADGVNPVQSYRSWNCAARVSASVLATLRTFFDAHAGGLPFYFYVPMEATPGTAIGSNWDGTGVSAVGLHVVRFVNDTWTETTTLARSNIAFGLQECG